MLYQLSSDETHNKAGARLPLPAITKIPLFKEHELDWVETEDMTSPGMMKLGALPGHLARGCVKLSLDPTGRY